MTTSARANSPRRRTEHPTSTRRAATAWLRALRRKRHEVRLFLEVLRLADMLKREERRTRQAELAAERWAARIRRQAARLEAEAPELVDVRMKERPGKAEDWRTPNLRYRVDRAFEAFTDHHSASARFTRATNAIPGMLAPGRMDESTKSGPLHAALLTIAAKCVGIDKPSGLQAAVMAIAVGVEDPARNFNQQVEAEVRWKARFRLVEQRVEEALLTVTLDPREGTVFGGDVKPGTRKGR